MQTYSMIFLDIDGTLLNSANEVSPRTKALLNRLERRGIPEVLCSARSPGGVELVAQQAGIHGPAVCYSGSLILAPDRSILHDTGIEAETAVAFKQLVAARFPTVTVSTYLYDVWLVDDTSDPYIQREARITRCEPLAGALAAAVRSASHVHKLLCTGAQRELLQLQKSVGPQFPELELVRSGAAYLEVLAKNVTKATAMQTLQTHYGVRREQIVACGDYFADLDMLRQAGFGVAMGNAPERVKQAAAWVTASNDEDGVYIALKNLKFRPPEPVPVPSAAVEE